MRRVRASTTDVRRVMASKRLKYIRAMCRVRCAVLTAAVWMASVASRAEATSALTTLTLDQVWPDVGAVYASTTVELHGSGYTAALPPLGCRFGEIVSAKDASTSTTTKTVCATPTNVVAGFVAVGLSQATGRKYVAGVDDLVVDNGQHSFEFVKPWKLASASPDHLFRRGGEIVRLSGEHLRPGMECVFEDSGLTSEYRFVSSALAMCESRASTAESGTIDLSLTPYHSTGGAEVAVTWVATPEDLASITPSRGSTTGGTRTVLKRSGSTTTPSSFYAPQCRFGTIITSAVHVPGGAVACSSPAHYAANATVGIEGESDVTFQYLDDIVIDGLVPAGIPSSGGDLTLHLAYPAACTSWLPLQCVFVTSAGTQIKTDLDTNCKCASPETGIGFATLAAVVSVSSSNSTAFIDEAAGNYIGFELQTTTPAVEVFLPYGGNWIQAEEVIKLITADGSLLGDNVADGDFWCVFGQAAQFGGSTVYSVAVTTSGTTLKCAVPDLDDFISVGETGFEVVVGICSSSEVSSLSCTHNGGTRLRYEKKMGVASRSPVNGTQDGGDIVTLVDASTIKGFGANVPSCRFGTIYPVVATTVTGTGELNCITPAHVAGVVPVSVPPLDLGLTSLTFEYIELTPTQAEMALVYGADPYVSATLVDPTPTITEISPWVGWSGSVVTLTGAHLPTGPDVRCRFGSVSVDAQVISTALIRCGDTVPVTTDDIEEQLVSVTTTTGETNPNVTALQHYVVSKGDITTIDADDGWQQGGNTVGIRVNSWVPEGSTACLFGTITVQSRGGTGYGAIGKASLSQTTQWWLGSSDTTDVECVSPAHAKGDVQLGVSISGASTSSFVGTTFKYI